MTAAERLNLISVEDYLARESVSDVKHDYVDGRMYRRIDERIVHNTIAVNIVGSLFTSLRGKACRPYTSDAKIRVRLKPERVRFYYPDASVICRSNPWHDSFQDEPVAIFEVLSRETRRIDEWEKREACLTIPSLRVYAMVEQDTAAVVVHRRTEQGFVREVYEGMNAVIPLSEIETELPLAEVYDRVEFVPEPEEEG